jgi:hypothetical protein
MRVSLARPGLRFHDPTPLPLNAHFFRDLFYQLLVG